MDDTTYQFDDDVDARLKEPTQTDKEVVQGEGADAEMNDAQQGNDNLETTQEQVVEDAHVTISTITKKTKVPVTSSSRTDNQEKDEKQSQNDKTGLGMEKTVKDKAKSKPKTRKVKVKSTQQINIKTEPYWKNTNVGNLNPSENGPGGKSPIVIILKTVKTKGP
ncbi:hypothetical protein Tco_0898469 [Tanacetum coccineum]